MRQQHGPDDKVGKSAGGNDVLDRINPHAAGIDCGSAEHFVAVPPDRDATPVRSFATFTGDLHRLADWLVACLVTHVAMEATGVYWIPVFEILEARGVHVILVNARHVKNVPGRKSDVSDCEWLRDLHIVGLLRGSFRPADAIVALRAYLRHRASRVESAGTHIRRMQKALVQMNLQLPLVVSDITGVTGLRILRDIVAGHRDPHHLAQHRDYRCRASAAEIVAALTGNYRPEHVFVLQQNVALFDAYQQQLTACDTAIEAHLHQLTAQVAAPATPLPPPPPARTHKRSRVRANEHDIREEGERNGHPSAGPDHQERFYRTRAFGPRGTPRFARRGLGPPGLVGVATFGRSWARRRRRLVLLYRSVLRVKRPLAQLRITFNLVPPLTLLTRNRCPSGVTEK